MRIRTQTLEAASKTCGKCEARSFKSAKFCADCGALLDPPGEPSSPELIRQFAKDVVGEVETAGKQVLKSDIGKKMAAGAAVGAAIAAAVPLVGWATGAALGAGIVAYKRFTR